MNPVYSYFRDIILGVWTTLLGMKVTIRHLFMPTITVQYPHQKLTYPPRARAALVNHIDACNGDLQCARACPVDIIDIQTVKAQPEDNAGNMPDGKPRRLLILKFDVDMSKCVFCGLCVDVCPTGSLHWETPHEPVGFSREQTMRRWSKYSLEDRKRLLERDAALKAAKAEAAAKAATAKSLKDPSGPAPAPKAKVEFDPPPKTDSEGTPPPEKAKKESKPNGQEGE